MAAGWPKLADVRTVLRLQPDPTEDAVIDSARLAAIDYGVKRTSRRVHNADGTVSIVPPYPPDVDELPDALYEAALLDSARIYRRRDSLDGTVAWGDMGAIRVGRADPDVDRLYATVGPVVFG
jgi:hypothetical protein